MRDRSVEGVHGANAASRQHLLPGKSNKLAKGHGATADRSGRVGGRIRR